MNTRDADFVTAKEAQEILAVNKTRMTQLLKDVKRLPTYRRAVDMRVKWLRCEDVERVAVELRQPQAEPEPRPRAKRKTARGKK